MQTNFVANQIYGIDFLCKKPLLKNLLFIPYFTSHFLTYILSKYSMHIEKILNIWTSLHWRVVLANTSHI